MWRYNPRLIEKCLAEARIVIPVLLKMTRVQKSVQMLAQLLLVVQGHDKVIVLIPPPDRVKIDLAVGRVGKSVAGIGGRH